MLLKLSNSIHALIYWKLIYNLNLIYSFLSSFESKETFRLHLWYRRYNKILLWIEEYFQYHKYQIQSKAKSHVGWRMLQWSVTVVGYQIRTWACLHYWHGTLSYNASLQHSVGSQQNWEWGSEMSMGPVNNDGHFLNLKTIIILTPYPSLNRSWHLVVMEWLRLIAYVVSNHLTYVFSGGTLDHSKKLFQQLYLILTMKIQKHKGMSTMLSDQVP